MMQLVYKKKPVCFMTTKSVQSIAKTLSFTNKEAFINTKSDPFTYIDMLKEYGVFASARPVIRNRRIIGYKFKKVA